MLSLLCFADSYKLEVNGRRAVSVAVTVCVCICVYVGGPSPYTNPASAASSVPAGTSYLDKHPDRAWNDPPIVQYRQKRY